jgi:hypothetical protein
MQHPDRGTRPTYQGAPPQPPRVAAAGGPEPLSPRAGVKAPSSTLTNVLPSIASPAGKVSQVLRRHPTHRTNSAPIPATRLTCAETAQLRGIALSRGCRRPSTTRLFSGNGPPPVAHQVVTPVPDRALRKPGFRIRSVTPFGPGRRRPQEVYSRCAGNPLCRSRVQRSLIALRRSHLVAAHYSADRS